MDPAQPGREPLIITFVFEELPGKSAYGHQTEDGPPTIHADFAIFDNDPDARSSAFEVLQQLAG